MIACGVLALVASGGVGALLALVCAAGLAAAWKLEDSRWRLSERAGLGVVALSLPLFYLDWQYLAGTGLAAEKVGVTALAHLILLLSAVKLAQRKADRDWVFLYLISFFEVLLAAGLSISPLFFLSLLLYLLCALSTIIAFEIQKAQRAFPPVETRLLAPPDAKPSKRFARYARRPAARRLPLVAALLLGLILLLATPLFFMMPRFNAATFARTNGGLSGFTGFSDSVRLGDVGKLQQSDQVVMRVQVENAPARPLRWRGVGLDSFDGLVWRKSKPIGALSRNNGDFFAVDGGGGRGPLTTQTFYLEPLDTPILFAAPRVINLQGRLPFLRVDAEGGLASRPHDSERLSYRVVSDTNEPDAAELQDEQPLYDADFQRYTKLPPLDPRIAQLTRRVLDQARPRSMYDAARAIEAHLQNSYGYSLDMKARGDDPLADFLFRVREGHCEYFASAMVVMLRTQGVAARIVNGFQSGEYNSTAGFYTVTQRDAHSWVEVYFPKRKAWVTFDPTPAAGRAGRSSTGLISRLGKYGEALEMLWIQYVVAYDRNEQRSLTSAAARRFEAARDSLNSFYEGARRTFVRWKDAFSSANTNDPVRAAVRRRVIFGALAGVVLSLLLVIILRRAWRVLRRRRERLRRAASVVAFYERMTKLLARRGLQRAPHETPFEFALATGLPLTAKITDAYHRVRYGGQAMSSAEATEIEGWLREMETEKL
jgi:transglutaminase-like putative cysteine protease